MDELTNLDRAMRAEEALSLYVEEGDGAARLAEIHHHDAGNLNSEAVMAAQDLICDLLHLVKLRGGTVSTVLRQAENGFWEEHRGEL